MAAMRGWSQEDDRQLMLNWSRKTLRELAEMFDCEISTIQRHAAALRKLGVKLPPRMPSNGATRPKAQAAVVENPVFKNGYWSDNWSIKPPSPDRLRAGR